MEGKLGVIAPGAFADLVAVDGNPLEDLGLLQEQGKHLPLIMKAGRVVKNTLHEMEGTQAMTANVTRRQASPGPAWPCSPPSPAAGGRSSAASTGSARSTR